MEDPVIKLDIPSKLEFVALARDAITKAAEVSNSLNDIKLDDLRWLISEATTNAIEANYDNGPECRVYITCQLNSNGVRLTVTDEGPGIHKEVNTSNILEPLNLEQEGSLGIPLMKHLSNMWRYHTSPAGTTVEMELRQVG